MQERLSHIKESIQHTEYLCSKIPLWYLCLLSTDSEYLINTGHDKNGSFKTQWETERGTAGIYTPLYSLSTYSQVWLNWNFPAIMNIWTKLPQKMHTGGEIKQGDINNAQVMGSVVESATPIQTVIFINNKLRGWAFVSDVKKYWGQHPCLTPEFRSLLSGTYIHN